MKRSARSNRAHCHVSPEAAVAASVLTLILSVTAVAQGQAPTGNLTQQVAAQERHLHDARLFRDLAHMEAAMWHATAAVAFFIADDRPTDRKVAHEGYLNYIADFERHGADASSRLSPQIVEDHAHLAQDWAQFKQRADNLVEAGADDPKHAAGMRELWDLAVKIDGDLETMRERAGQSTGWAGRGTDTQPEAIQSGAMQ